MTQLGSRLSHGVAVQKLRVWLTLIIALAAARVWVSVLGG